MSPSDILEHDFFNTYIKAGAFYMQKGAECSSRAFQFRSTTGRSLPRYNRLSGNELIYL